jgi:HTH-type transcriptional regulator/antitoxin HigA
MSDFDDFFVMNDVSQVDLNKAIEKYKYFKNSSIPINHLRKYFGVLLQNNEDKMMFRKKEIANNPFQEFWALRFLDMAENNYENLSVTNFSGLEKDDLREVAKISLSENRITEVKHYLMAKGIYLYFIDSLSGTKIDGAVYKTNSSTIAIGLTVRFERLDYLWFTLLHELSHVVLHNKFLSEGINISIEDSQEIEEVEANRLAKESIISPEKYRVCSPKRTRDSKDMVKYARDNHIHPALLAGLIRRDLNRFDIFSDIIQSYKVNRSDLYERI